MKDRLKLVILGVEYIYFFNDKRVEFKIFVGEMVIEGENLDMSKLSIDENIISIDGIINFMVYVKFKKL